MFAFSRKVGAYPKISVKDIYTKLCLVKIKRENPTSSKGRGIIEKC